MHWTSVTLKTSNQFIGKKYWSKTMILLMKVYTLTLLKTMILLMKVDTLTLLKTMILLMKVYTLALLNKP
jgi:hypothetical protein